MRQNLGTAPETAEYTCPKIGLMLTWEIFATRLRRYSRNVAAPNGRITTKTIPIRPPRCKRNWRQLSAYLKSIQPRTVWDLGANTGVFSRIASELGSFTCAFDVDPSCVERAYLDGRKQNKLNFLPLRMDLTNPSPALGWAHHERDCFASRGPADATMALALVHHLAVSNNVPLPAIADFFRRLAPCLIIEFVPKQDPQVQRLLQNRADIFDDYNQAAFEHAFEQHFHLRESQSVGNDGRRIYFMQAP